MSSESSLASRVRGFDELQTLLESHREFSEDSSIYMYYLTSFDTGIFKEKLVDINWRFSKFDTSVSHVDSTDSRDLLRMEFTHEKEKHITEGFVLFDIDHEYNIIKAVTDGGSDVIASCMQITDKLYPLFGRFFISSEVIINILNQFVDAGYDGYCTQYTFQRWWNEGETPKSGVEYPTEIPLSTILEEFSDQPSIAVKMFRGYINVEGDRLLEFYINREGEIRFIDGEYGLFSEISNMVSQQAIEEVSEYEGMGKDGANEYLEIEFEEIVEEEERDDIIAQFRQAIQSENTFSEAVIHAGNPYYHSSLSDRERGSSFELVFFQDGEDFQLEILPSHTFSSLSVLKFKRAIFSEFGEGDIRRMSIEG